MRVLRWVAAGLSILLVIVLVGAAGLFFWYRQASLPELEGTLGVGALSRPVRIDRDAVGLASITAQSEADALFALGFVHAQDRLWQIEFNRRIGQGRISELVGPPGLDTDRFLRTLGIHVRAQRMAAELDSPTRELLESYCAGINAYLDQRREPLPAEFVLLRAPRPERWVPADVMAWSLMMAWDLSSHGMRNELDRLRLASRLSKAEIDEFLPPWDPAPPAVADYVALYHGLGLAGQPVAAWAGGLAALLPERVVGAAQALGSNNWVVGGTRSASGRPLLANDPHLGLSTPSVWYMARLSAPGLEVFGATLPGVPYVVLGRNAHVAWGFTNTYADTQDLYLEEVLPDHPDRYRTPDGDQPFDTRIERIRVRGAEPVDLTVRSTRHGPVISGALASADAAAPGGRYVLALKWTALEPGDATLRAFRAINRAADTVQFELALRDVGTIVQNVVFAGDDGHIGLRVAGRVPLRGRNDDLLGVAPAPGWQARYDWQRWMEPDELPNLRDPPGGVIVTANQKIAPPGYAGFLTTEWQAPFRAQRIEQRLAAVQRHDLASFESIQADVTSLPAREMMQALSRAEPSTELGRAALQRLRAWDGSMRVDRPEPLLYHAWVDLLKRRVFDDDLGPLAHDLVEPSPLTGALLAVMNGRTHARTWCDDAARAEPHADCMQLAGQTLDQAAAGLARTPAGLDQLRWGARHGAVFEHRPLSNVAPLRGWFEQRIAQPGDDDTVDVGHLRLAGEEPFEARAGPSLRLVFDLSDPLGGAWMFAPGQSGSPFSARFGDLLEDWSRVRYRALTASAPAARTLILKPGLR